MQAITPQRRLQILRAKQAGFDINMPARIVEVPQNEILNAFLLPNGTKVCSVCFDQIKGMACECCNY